MHISDIRKLDFNEKISFLKEYREKLKSLKIQHSSTRVNNPMEIKKLRKAIAKVLTVLNTHSE